MRLSLLALGDTDNDNRRMDDPIIFGYREEWAAFGKRNKEFLEKFPHLEATIKLCYEPRRTLNEPIDKVVLFMGRTCVEDFTELLMCCGNGCGRAAQILLRSLYERAVTLRYLHEHPECVTDFLDYNDVQARKFAKAVEEAYKGIEGREPIYPSDVREEIEERFLEVKDRFMRTLSCPDCGAEVEKRLNHTWGLDFASMANKTDLARLKAFCYDEALAQAHPTVASFIRRMQHEDGGVSFREGSQPELVDKTLRLAHSVILNTLLVQSERFETPGLKEQIDRCYADYMAIWRDEKANVQAT
jgi:Family of unknown function (DUF5677)